MWPPRRRSSWPLSRSHRLTVWSQLPGEGPLAVRRKRHAADPFGVPFKSAEFPAARQVPEPDRAVAAPGQGRLPSGEKATASTSSVCPSSGRSSRPLATSQKRSCVVFTAGEGPLAVRRERDAQHVALVPLERPKGTAAVSRFSGPSGLGFVPQVELPHQVRERGLEHLPLHRPALDLERPQRPAQQGRLVQPLEEVIGLRPASAAAAARSTSPS